MSTDDEVEIQKLSECMDRNMAFSEDDMEDLEYELDVYQYRGLVLVFNHENFDPNLALKPRAGTATDAKRLKEVFVARGFRALEPFNDSPHAKIKRMLKQLSDVKQEVYGSVVVIVLSHGLEGDQIAAKDKFYSASDLREPFLDNPAFKGKPLIFIHQACKKRETFGSVAKSGLACCNGEVLHSGQNDILLAFATLDGHERFRHKKKGSLYIQKMCDIMEKRGDIEILDLLTEANCEVIDTIAEFKQRMEDSNKFQTATFKSTLLKKFVLRKCSMNLETLNSTSGNSLNPEECEISQCEYRGPAIIFHDENHISEANEFLESMKALNFSCQTVDHEPTERELQCTSSNLRLEDCSYLFIGIFFPESRHNFLHSRLLEYLNNKSCPYMNSKPKIFLFACKKGATSNLQNMDDITSSRQVSAYTDVLAIYGYSTKFLKNFAAHLKKSQGSNIIASARVAQRCSAQDIERPCNVIMSSTLRFRVDCSKEKPVLNDNTLQVSSVFQYNVHDPVTNFQSRTKELEQMRKHLQSDVRHGVAVWLAGFGGLGKTQTVQQYIKEVRTQNIYQNILWVNGSSIESINRDFQNITENLDINLPLAGLKDKIQCLYKKFTAFGKTLLVVDNLELITRDKIIDILPADQYKDSVRIVVTSRHNVESFGEVLISKVTKGNRILINPFTGEESNDFITKNMKSVDNIPQTLIDALGEELSYFPIGLAIAVGLANVQMKSGTSPSDVIENIIKNMKSIQNVDSSTKGYEKSLYHIIKCTLNHLVTNKEELALKYLQMMSFCEPDDIPHKMLFQCDRVGVDVEAVGILKALQIINTNANFYSIHRIIQNIVRSYFNNNDDQECVLSLLQNVSKLHEKRLEYPETRKYILHAAKVCNNLASFSEHYETYIKCIITISSELQLVGWYEDAMVFDENHLKISSKILGIHSKVYSDLLFHKVKILRRLEQDEEALTWIKVLENLEPYNDEPSLEKKICVFNGEKAWMIQYSCDIWELLYGNFEPCDPCNVEIETLLPIGNDEPKMLVTPNVDMERIDIFKRITEFSRREANHFSTNVAVQKAGILLTLGELNEAQQISNNLFQPHALFTYDTKSDIMNIRAEMFIELERFDEALELLDLDIEFRERNHLENSYRLLTIKHNKARLLALMKRFKEAKEMFDNLKLIREERLGVHHPVTFAVRNTVANVEYKMGNYEEALKCTNEILQDIGDNTKNISMKISVLIVKFMTLVQLKRFTETEEIVKYVYELRNIRFVENDLRTFDDMFAIARIFRAIGDLKNALNWLQTLHLKQTQKMAENRIRILRTEVEMSKILYLQGKYDESLDLENCIYSKQCTMFGILHYQTARTMKRIAKILFYTGKLDNALQNCENAITVLTSENGEQYAMDIIKIILLKSKILIALQNLEKALASLQDAMQRAQMLENCQHNKAAILFAVKQSYCDVQFKIGMLEQASALMAEMPKQMIVSSENYNLTTFSAMDDEVFLLYTPKHISYDLSEIETFEKLQETKFGATHRSSLHTKYFKGLMLSHSSRHSEALQIFDFVLEHRKKVLDDDHAEVRNTMNQRAKVLLNMKRFNDALCAFQSVLDVDKRKYGTDSMQVARSMNALGKCYDGLQEYGEAFSMYGKAYEIMRLRLGPTHPYVELLSENIDSTMEKCL